MSLRVSVRIDPKLYKTVEEMAKRDGRSRANMVDKLLTEAIARSGDKRSGKGDRS